ncbi:MAG: PfkB family carbohydrate kinase [Alphaproteobacteria bacterium]|nr:PfkB family carbohydrate kinase [Alphaproteobacteria bacterium]
MLDAPWGEKVMVKKVVVFGSYNVDKFFDIEDINFFVQTGKGAQDALHFSTHKEAPGGKGANQAIAAAKAGAVVHFFGAVGRGAKKSGLFECFRRAGVKTSGVAESSYPTGQATIFRKPDGQHKIVVSHGANDKANHRQVPERALAKNTIVVLQAEVDLTQNARLVARARKKGATVVLNVAPAAKIEPGVLGKIDYLILNRPEAEVVADYVGLSARSLEEFAQTMRDRFALSCIVTLGKDGLLAALLGDREMCRVPALRVEAVDTVGAGDAFVGAFVAALAAGVEPREALRHGAVGGSLACTRVGAQAALPTAREIRRNLSKLG